MNPATLLNALVGDTHDPSFAVGNSMRCRYMTRKSFGDGYIDLHRKAYGTNELDMHLD